MLFAVNEPNEENIDRVFKHCNSLKSLDLSFDNMTNETLAAIAESCLELQALRIDCKFLTRVFLNIYFYLIHVY